MEFTQLLTPEFKDWDPQVHCLILLPLQRKISLLPWKQALFFNAGVIATKFFLFSLNLCILEVLSESTHLQVIFLARMDFSHNILDKQCKTKHTTILLTVLNLLWGLSGWSGWDNCIFSIFSLHVLLFIAIILILRTAWFYQLCMKTAWQPVDDLSFSRSSQKSLFPGFSSPTPLPTSHALMENSKFLGQLLFRVGPVTSSWLRRLTKYPLAPSTVTSGQFILAPRWEWCLQNWSRNPARFWKGRGGV